MPLSELEALVIMSEPVVHRWFSRRVNHEDDVEDLVQECMCAIIESHAGFKRHSTERTWVHGICRNLFFHYLRGKSAQPMQMQKDVVENVSYDHDAQLAILMAAELLPSRLRSVYELRYVQNRPITEISEFLNRPVGTIKYQLYEIRTRLGKSINPPTSVE